MFLLSLGIAFSRVYLDEMIICLFYNIFSIMFSWRLQSNIRLVTVWVQS